MSAGAADRIMHQRLAAIFVTDPTAGGQEMVQAALLGDSSYAKSNTRKKFPPISLATSSSCKPC